VAATFFDRDGTPIRQLIRSKDFTETYSARGNQRHLIVPGVGPVLAQAGHFLIDGKGNLVDVSGLNIPAGSEFCAALSA
jgi:hypothetical protein